MRLLCCTDTWAPQVNGVTVVTVRSITGLQARGWDCAVVAPRYPAGTPGIPAPAVEPGGVTSLPSVPFPNYRDVRFALPDLLAVRRAIRDFRPDLVHCATEFVIGRLGMWAARAAGIPVVTSYHTDFARYASAYGTPWLEAPIRTAIARFHQQAARVYTPGHAARDDLAALGIRHVEVWGRGVDAQLFHPGRRDLALRERLGADDAVVFLCVSRLAPEKGIATVLEAFRRAAARWPAGRMQLVIAGTGPDEATLRAAAPPGVQFLGTLDRLRELPHLYASADAFCFASQTETLGLVVLEAMASGLPVIAIPALGVAETLRDGTNGIAVPGGADAAVTADAMADAMVRVAQDRELRCRLRAGALATAAEFSWETELDRLDASYREVLAGAGRRVASPQVAVAHA